MQAKQKLILSMGDVLIPLFGFFYLNWSLYFIALYLLLDLIGNFIFYHIKARKRITYSKNKEDKQAYVQGSVLLSLLLLALISTTHLFAFHTQPGIDFIKEFIAFLMYVEEPIPVLQFWFLIPLILLPPYQQYKMEFIMQQKFRSQSVKSISRNFQIDALFALGLLTLASLMSIFLELPHLIWLILFIALKLSYDYFLRARILAHK